VTQVLAAALQAHALPELSTLSGVSKSARADVLANSRIHHKVN
jgi:hypothetical protein